LGGDLLVGILLVDLACNSLSALHHDPIMENVLEVLRSECDSVNRSDRDDEERNPRIVQLHVIDAEEEVD
ncbi:hypothetical protein PMAYCL1PPCAC_18682, partial [Pristionchus mayeri]